MMKPSALNPELRKETLWSLQRIDSLLQVQQVPKHVLKMFEVWVFFLCSFNSMPDFLNSLFVHLQQTAEKVEGLRADRGTSSSGTTMATTGLGIPAAPALPCR